MSEQEKLEKGYNDDSIKSLKGADRVRLRPGVMFGSDDLKGAFHTFKEIMGNSLDEARGGYGKDIKVTYHKDGAISVRDHGRGVPMGWNEKEQRWNWDLVFNELYAGGKYDEDEVYKFSVGLNGLGAAAVQYTSEYFIVTSYKGNVSYTKEFMEGNPLDDELVEETLDHEEWGTSIKWKVDNKVFRDTKFKFSAFKDYCEGQAHINEVNIKLVDEHTGEEVLYEGKGAEYYLREKLGDKVIEVLNIEKKLEGIDDRNQKYSTECEVCLAMTEETQSQQFYFHNTATMIAPEGQHIKATQAAILDYFRNIGKQNNVTIMPYDYEDYLSVIVSSYSNITSFANQTKDGVSDQFIYDIIYKSITDVLAEAVAKGNDNVKNLTTYVVNAAIARKKAKEVEAQERAIKKATKKKEKAEKFVDCESKNPAEKELFIVEGDSALSSCKDARDSKFQALLPIRGKTLNCLKASIESVINSQVIKDIITTVGTGVDIGGKNKELFNMSNLQFDKIIFTTDGDVDGFQIRVLLYTIFYRLMPELLRQGKVYVAETPLFEIEIPKQKSRFAYSVEEKDIILKELKEEGIKKYKVHRSKGLGENDPDMLWETTMAPETRKLVPLTIDVKDRYVIAMTDMLFGNDKDVNRKNYIFHRLQEGIIDLEIEKGILQENQAVQELEEVEEAI